MPELTNEEYARATQSFEAGRHVRFGGKVYTNQADLDAALGKSKPADPPENAREGRERDLKKMLKSDLQARAGALGLPTEGTADDLRADILDAEYPQE